MFDPAREGFSPRLCAIDRCQMVLLRALAGKFGARLYLKGGMAMRALFGSLRLTKDIDFERAANLSNDSLRGALPKALEAAALGAGLLAPRGTVTKSTRTTVRAALQATLAATGEPVQYEVEVSGQGLPPQAHRIHLSVAPPVTYRMTPFGVNSYDADAMAASKVAALHSETRSVPRDIFDLNDLVAQGANAAALLRAADGHWLDAIAGTTLAKVSAIGWNRANEELLPYLPAGAREAMHAAAWDALCLEVAKRVDSWIREARGS